MSLLGEIVDSFINSISGITDVISNILSIIVNFISSLVHLVSFFIDILNYIYTFLGVIIEIMLDPTLFLSFILIGSLYYASFKANTKKDLLIQLGVYFKYVGETISKILSFVFYLVSKLVIGIIDMI